MDVLENPIPKECRRQIRIAMTPIKATNAGATNPIAAGPRYKRVPVPVCSRFVEAFWGCYNRLFLEKQSPMITQEAPDFRGCQTYGPLYR